MVVATDNVEKEMVDYTPVEEIVDYIRVEAIGMAEEELDMADYMVDYMVDCKAIAEEGKVVVASIEEGKVVVA